MYDFISHSITDDAVVTEFSSYLEDFWWSYVEDRMNHELVAATTKWACVEMIDSGVTSFIDILEGPNSIPHALEIEREIVEEAGLRGKLSFEACERVSKEKAKLGLEENISFIKRHNNKGNLVEGINSIHTLFTCSPEFVTAAKKMSDECGAQIHMHLSESCFEPNWCRDNVGKTPVEIYEELGYLDSNVLASQVVQVSDKELDILAKNNVAAVSMPISNCEVGGGFAPISKMLDRGMTVGLGTDGYVNNFFEVMRGAFLMHKANQQNPQVMPAETVYKMATSMGAKAIKNDKCGSIKVGNLADIITVDVMLPTPINEHNIYDQLVLFCNPDKVMNVMVGGRLLKMDGEIRFIDRESALKELRIATAQFVDFNA